MEQELLSLEREGWDALCTSHPAAYYDRVMTPEALFVVPGMVLTRNEVLASWQDTKPWANYDLSDERVVALGPDAAALTYAGTATRADDSVYEARFTSVYVRREGAWHLAFHQQTP
jgi:hypothetical protein